MNLIDSVDKLDLGAYLKRGDHIVWGQACGEPTTLIEALIEQAKSIGDLSGFTATSFSGLLTPAFAQTINLSSMGAMGALREVAAARRLTICPSHVGQIGRFIMQGIMPCDVAFVQVSPPDVDGNHSFGLTNDYIQSAVRKARVVIAEINEQVPYTYCDAMLSADKIDCAISVSRTPVEVAAAPISAADRKIASFAADYIDDQSVLQVGIGGAPDAILRLIGDRRDLGVHSGMIGDGIVDLIEAGAVTNSRKTIDAGVSITGTLIGTRRLFDFARENPVVGMRKAAYTHNESVLAQIEKLVTINSALEVDLTGQINAEQSGDKYIGGTGGQVDFVRAGARAAGGRSIIALSSTAKGGAVSRIAARLSGPVTTTRSEADVIITEYGAAELKGLSLAERTKRLIMIAHPDFREALDRAARDIRERGF